MNGKKAKALPPTLITEASTTTHPCLRIQWKEIFIFLFEPGGMGMMDIWFAWHKRRFYISH